MIEKYIQELNISINNSAKLTAALHSNRLFLYLNKPDVSFQLAKIAIQTHSKLSWRLGRMIAQDLYLKEFIRNFTQANSGKAFFTGLKGLGEMIFEDYEQNRKKRLR